MSGLRAVTAATAPISLTELNEQAALLRRVDRKYLVTREIIAAVLAEASAREPLQVLEIEGRRDFGYTSTYFDTSSLSSYHATAHRHRRRYKLRRRTYSDTGCTWLEMKFRSRRGETIKHRLPVLATPWTAGLAPQQLDTVDSLLDEWQLPAAARDMRPVLRTDFRRTTFYAASSSSRITLDDTLAWTVTDIGTASPATHRMPSDLVVLETKTSGLACAIDRMLWARGHRPRPLSKYGLGMAALHPDLPANRWHRTLCAVGAPRSTSGALATRTHPTRPRPARRTILEGERP